MNRSNKSLSKHSMDRLYQDIVEIPSDEVWETRTSPTFFTVKNHSELALMRFWRGTGVTIFGIDDFEAVAGRDDPLIFEPSDFYYRGIKPEEANAWLLNIYAFPIGVVPPVRFKNGSAVLEVALEGLNPPWVSVLELKVVHLPAEKVFLGLLLNRFKFSGGPKSGWAINGPGDWTMQQKGHVLMASYPAMKAAVAGRGSLDRGSKLPSNE